MEASKRFHSLDLLKFLLAVVIIFHHFQQITGARFAEINFYGGSIIFGYVVECFFIISGFVTALGLEKKPLVSFRKWMMSKCIRIYPMAILSVIFTAFVYFLHKILLGAFPEGVTLGLWQFLNSVTLTFVGWVGNLSLGINNPVWYLCVLLICYVFAYILNWVSRRLKIDVRYFYFAIMTIGISVVTYKLNLPFLNLATGRGFTAFFFGMLFYYAYKWVSKKILVGYSVLCLVLCAVCAVVKIGIDDQWGIFTFMIWPSVLILFLSCESLFKWNGFSVLGTVSFEMYLWHVSAIWIFVIAKAMMGKTNYTFIEMMFFTSLLIIISFGLLQVEKKITGFLYSKFVLKENR